MVIRREAVQISRHDLRALLHWACNGVERSYGGSYEDIDEIIYKYSKQIRFQLPCKPEFRRLTF